MKTKHFFIVLAAVAVCFTACKKDEKATPVTGITLNYEKLTLIPGDTITLIATVQPNDADNKTVIWKSSKPDVATVNSGGLVTAVANGEATITATTQDGNKTATCIVTVDYRSQWVGEWFFETYLGRISYGIEYDVVSIDFLEQMQEPIFVKVNEKGKLLRIVGDYSFLYIEGEFEGENKIYFKLIEHAQGGGGTFIINGTKKEGDKK